VAAADGGVLEHAASKRPKAKMEETSELLCIVSENRRPRVRGERDLFAPRSGNATRAEENRPVGLEAEALALVPPGDIGWVVFVSVRREEALSRLETIKKALTDATAEGTRTDRLAGSVPACHGS
ncbi:MAG: hypothetical protein JWO86_585, partial [Myxococcaceae bacterium]|nr:hypothetical protein [Myxococcaceae bacterium]